MLWRGRLKPLITLSKLLVLTLAKITLACLQKRYKLNPFKLYHRAVITLNSSEQTYVSTHSPKEKCQIPCFVRTRLSEKFQRESQLS